MCVGWRDEYSYLYFGVMTLSLCCCHILTFSLFLHFLGSRRKWSLFSMTAGPVGRHFRLLAPPPPSDTSHSLSGFPSDAPPTIQNSNISLADSVKLRPHDPFSMNGTCIDDALLPNKVHFNWTSYCGKELRGTHARSTETSLEIVKNERGKIFCAYLTWKYANRKQEARICNHFVCGLIHLRRQIV